MKIDKKFTDLAISLANTSEHKFRVGSVLVSGKDVIATGVNIFKSHPYQKLYNQNRHFEVEIHNFIHAETAAILSYRRNRIEIPKLRIYIARLNKHGDLMDSFPCPACYKMLSDNNVRNIIFSQDGQFNYVKL